MDVKKALSVSNPVVVNIGTLIDAVVENVGDEVVG